MTNLVINPVDKVEMKLIIKNSINELNDWFLPELDMKQAKKMAKELRKVLAIIQND